MLLPLILIFNFLNFGTVNYQPPEHVKIANEITLEVGERISSRHNLKIIGDYGALFDTINALGFRFQAIGPLSKDKLRQILIDCTEDLVASVNQREGIEKYLGSYPFTYKNVDLSIFIKDKKGCEIHFPSYGVASLTNGEIDYITDEENKLRYTTVETESYEDALKMVQGKLLESGSVRHR